MTAHVPLSEMPGHLIRRMNQHSASAFQNRVANTGHDITSVQFSALNTLADHPGLDQATLARRIAYDRATIGGVVKRLEQKELVRRQTDDEDRRAFKLWLSPAGQALLDDLRPVVAALQDDILANLTESEKTTLIGLMKKTLGLNTADSQKT